MNRFSDKKDLYDYLIEPIKLQHLSGLACTVVDHYGYAPRYSHQAQATGHAGLIDLSLRLDHALKKRWAVTARIKEHDYIWHLYKADQMLRQGNYCLACHELIDVLHFSVSRQVLINVQALIRPYLGGK